jgi:hypothetical protein
MTRANTDQTFAARFASRGCLAGPGARVVTLVFAFALFATASALQLNPKGATPLAGIGDSAPNLAQQGAAKERADNSPHSPAARA